MGLNNTAQGIDVSQLKSRRFVAEVMGKVVREIEFLREAGQKEYAHDEDNAFANFERVADYLKLDRKKVLLTYMIKHVDGVVAYVNGHKSQREDVRGRINDIIVYGIILRAMIEHEEARDLSEITSISVVSANRPE